MEQQQQANLYIAPEVGVYETKIKAVICQSTQNAENNGYDSNDYTW